MLLPKNSYIIVDPCYVLSNEDYDTFIEGLSFTGGVESVNMRGVTIAVHCTAYGDGTYPSNSDVSFSVDAGIIAAVPLALCNPGLLEGEWVKDTSIIMHDTAVRFEYDDGTFMINELEIYTGSELHEEDDDSFF